MSRMAVTKEQIERLDLDEINNYRAYSVKSFCREFGSFFGVFEAADIEWANRDHPAASMQSRLHRRR
jgi:hypothetical protein